MRDSRPSEYLQTNQSFTISERRFYNRHNLISVAVVVVVVC